MIAALFVKKGGVYDTSEFDLWDISRDARKYNGPYHVIAHPPCERWGRYWFGGPNPKTQRRELGDDGGCFASALASVRKWGGVLEHPEASHAWKYFDLNKPPRSGGWVPADLFGGWTCCVSQGFYGHPAQKLTWLYSVGCQLPELRWGLSGGQKLEEGWHSTEERKRARLAGVKPIKRLSEAQRIDTPLPFRDLLVSIVNTCNR